MSSQYFSLKYYYYYYYYYYYFSRTTWVSRHRKGKPFWIWLEQGMMGRSGISWTICKSFSPRCRQITMPVPHHSVFKVGCPSCRPTNSVKALKADSHWSKSALLWPPYAIGHAIIFLPCDFYLLSIFFFSSSNLSGRRLDIYHTSTQGVALVQI